jgi:hypothetical protein
MEKEVKRMKDMMQSCYAYDSLRKDERYLAKYKNILGEDVFNKVYDEYEKYLETNYKIERNVYTDNEGLTYNSLIKL